MIPRAVVNEDALDALEKGILDALEKGNTGILQQTLHLKFGTGKLRIRIS